MNDSAMVKPDHISPKYLAIRIGARLRSYREARGLTQGAMKDQAGIAQPMICEYEKGGRSPSLGNLIVLADFFRISIDDLIGREIPPG